MKEIKKQLKDKMSEIENWDYTSDHYKMEHLVKELMVLINELRDASNDEKEKKECEVTYSQLNHTLNKELLFVESAYRKMKKKGSSKVRGLEFDKAIEASIRQIRSNIFGLIN